MNYSEKGRKYRSRKEYEKAKKKNHPKLAELLMTDREGNLLFKLLGRKIVTNSQIREELTHRVTACNIYFMKQKQ